MKRGIIILLLTAAIWGFSLVAQKAGMDVLGPWSFTGIRCTLAGLSLLPLAVYLDKKRKREEPDYDAKADTVKVIRPAFLCFIFLEGTTMFQQIGLQWTGVGKGAFITAFYIFLTPLFGLFLKQKVSGRLWAAVVISMAGLFLITMTGPVSSGDMGINMGDFLMFMAAFAYAGYIHAVDRAGAWNLAKLSGMQLLAIGLTSFVPAAILEPGDITWSNCVGSLIPILYSGIVSAAGGFTLQMVGQKYASPGVASIILSSETVFSLFAGWLFFNEILTPAEYAGCFVMVIAIALAVVPEKKNEKSSRESTENNQRT
ncbi:MAG: DMT family transporter [Bacillota bacterium]|nr:DMT family transporter [Bacillota bacterium]